MTTNGSNDPSDPIETDQTPSTENVVAAETGQVPPSEAPPGEALPDEAEDAPAVEGTEDAPGGPPQRILIGSQRDSDAYKPPRRDWEPVSKPDEGTSPEEQAGAVTPAAGSPGEPPAVAEKAETAASSPADIVDESAPAVPSSSQRFPPPHIRDQLPPELEDELEAAMGDESIESLMSGGDSLSDQQALEEDSRHTGRVIAVRRGDVFIELGSREQGSVQLKLFDEPPEVDAVLEVVVQKFNSEDGLYELSLPNKAASVDDWSDVHEGMLLAALIKGHNTRG